MFGTDSNTCWTKAGLTATGANPNRTLVVQKGYGLVETGWNFANADLGGIPNSTPAACEAACTANAQCVGAIFDTGGHTCYPKSALTLGGPNANAALYM